MGKNLHGASVITHWLKEYGYGKGMTAGIERLAKESRQAGQRDGFKLGVNYALTRMTVAERLLGRQIKIR